MNEQDHALPTEAKAICTQVKMKHSTMARISSWNRNLLVFAVLAVGLPLADPARGENLPDLALHDGQSLDGEWRCIIDPYETGFYDYRYNQRDKSRSPNPAETFYLDVKPANPSDRVEYDFDRSPTLRVPGDWNTQRPELLYYEGTLWYRRQFECAPLEAGERAFVRFGAANYRADVYLNGHRIGTHIGGFTPCQVNIHAIVGKL